MFNLSHDSPGKSPGLWGLYYSFATEVMFWVLVYRQNKTGSEKVGKIGATSRFSSGRDKKARSGQYLPGRGRAGKVHPNPYKHLLSPQVLVLGSGVSRRQLVLQQKRFPITYWIKCYFFGQGLCFETGHHPVSFLCVNISSAFSNVHGSEAAPLTKSCNPHGASCVQQCRAPGSSWW